MNPPYKYQVALSFSGEQRSYVEEVNRHLKSKGVVTFYDEDSEVELWGKHLGKAFHEIFEHTAEYVVLFISKDYLESDWAQHELDSAISRSIREKSEYILPVQFDDSKVLGLPTNIKYLDANSLSPAEIATNICHKIGINLFSTKSSDVPPPNSMDNAGEVFFDYSNNNGRYVIGNASSNFETKWSKASNRSIYILNDPPTIRGVAIARGCSSISQVRSADGLDFTSRSRTPQTGQVIVLQNTNGFYAAIQIIGIKDDTRGDAQDELHFRYAIQTDGTCDFSNF